MKTTFPLPFVIFLGSLFALAPVIGHVFAGYRYDDPNWGIDGSVITNFSGLDDFAHTLLLQADGKLMVAGEVEASPGKFGVARYLPDGQLDPTFGDGGLVTTSFGDDIRNVEAPWSINQRREGGYLIFGEICDSHYTLCELALAAYHDDGTLDQEFGTAGLVTTNPGYATAVAWPRRSIYQQNGKLVAAGVVLQEDGDVDLLLVRYNTDGSLDKTFGKDGITIIDFEETGNYPQDIMAIHGNKILITGGFAEPDMDHPFYYNPEDGFMARFNSDGKLDSSFAGGEGYFTWAYEELDTGGQAALPVDDDLYVMGYVDKNNGDCALQRYDRDGQLDKTFGDDGWVLIGGDDYNYCWDLLLTPDRKLAFEGENFPVYASTHTLSARQARGIRRGRLYTVSNQLERNRFSPGDEVSTILSGRYNLDGTPDEKYGAKGLVRHAFNDEGNAGTGLAVQPDGMMLVITDVYDTENGRFDWGIVRFLRDRLTPSTYLPLIAK